MTYETIRLFLKNQDTEEGFSLLPEFESGVGGLSSYQPPHTPVSPEYRAHQTINASYTCKHHKGAKGDRMKYSRVGGVLGVFPVLFT